MPKEPSATENGFSFIEVILAIAVIALLVTVFAGAIIYGQESIRVAENRFKARMLAGEGIDAVRNIRDNNYSSLTDGTFGLVVSSNQWSLSGSSDVSGIFTRRVTISTIDANTKQITANVSWQDTQTRTNQISIVTRLTNWRN